MNTFTTSKTSEALVDAAPEEVWEVLVCPERVAEFTPFIRRIGDLGDGRWRWELAGIPYPRGRFSASFTERMVFDYPERISFAHEQVPGSRDLAGVDGVYTLAPHEDGRKTALAIEVEVWATLPVPRWGAEIVTSAMEKVLTMMGDRFAANLLAELDTSQDLL